MPGSSFVSTRFTRKRRFLLPAIEIAEQDVGYVSPNPQSSNCHPRLAPPDVLKGRLAVEVLGRENRRAAQSSIKLRSSLIYEDCATA